MTELLAVDVGLKTGLALFKRDGKLRWYRSRKLRSPEHLKKAVYRTLFDIPELSYLVLEGGGRLADIWTHEADRRRISVLFVCAEAWRKQLLYPRHWRTGLSAKRNAGIMARRIIAWSGAPRPTSLRHDAAESILIGFWGVLKLGWLDGLPPEARRYLPTDPHST